MCGCLPGCPPAVPAMGTEQESGQMLEKDSSVFSVACDLKGKKTSLLVGGVSRGQFTKSSLMREGQLILPLELRF